MTDTPAGLRRQAAAQRADGFHDAARALEYRARQLALELVAEPIDLDSLLFIGSDGVRHIVDPNPREVELARRFTRGLPMGERALTERSLAHAFAAVREGSTLEGRRSTVGASYTVPAEVYRREGVDRLSLIRRAVRVRWARELFDKGLRPIGWPSVIARGYRYGDLRYEREVPLDRADVVVYRVEGEAVPE